MTGRSPLKQPGVPSKETAAEHARRIAKTRAAYASMSRRGGALHGALRPGSAASDRSAPRDSRGGHFSYARENARDGDGDDSEDAEDAGGSSAFAFATGRTNGHAKSVKSGASGAGAYIRTHPKKRETRLEPSVDVLAALAYARGAEPAPPRTSATARDSDESDDDGVTRASPRVTGNLRSRLKHGRDLSFPDDEDPLTPSRAWFARSARSSRSRADEWDASDVADEAEEATRRRFRAVAEFEAAARAKRARAAARAAANAANVAAAGAETAVANMRAEMEASVSASDERDETRNADANERRRARAPSLAPSLAPSPPPPTPRAPRGVTVDSKVRTPQDPFHAFANAAARTRTRPRDENEPKKGASYSASTALVAARDALAGAAAAAAELTKAAARTPPTARRWEHVSAHSETSGASASASASPRRRVGSRETAKPVSLRDGEPPTGDDGSGESPFRKDPTSVDAGTAAEAAEAPSAVAKSRNQISVALDFSAATRRVMDAGRARRAELLAAYQALAARCRDVASASSLAETRENGAEAPIDANDANDETLHVASNRVKTKTKPRSVETADTPNLNDERFVVPSRDDTLRLIRDMEDRARRTFAKEPNPPRTELKSAVELKSAATAQTAFASPRGLRTFARRPPSAVPTPTCSDTDSDDSAGLTPPPREKNDAARFFLSEEEKEDPAREESEGKGPRDPRDPRDPRLGLDVPPGFEPELRVSDVRDFESLVAYAFQ